MYVGMPASSSNAANTRASVGERAKCTCTAPARDPAASDPPGPASLMRGILTTAPTTHGTYTGAARDPGTKRCWPMPCLGRGLASGPSNRSRVASNDAATEGRSALALRRPAAGAAGSARRRQPPPPERRRPLDTRSLLQADRDAEAVGGQDAGGVQAGIEDRRFAEQLEAVEHRQTRDRQRDDHARTGDHEEPV